MRDKNIMKKKIILFAAGVVLLAASVTTFVCANKSNDPMDDLFRANVEALADIEGTQTTWSCDGSLLKRCSAVCGSCGTSISGRGNLTGMHRCQ